MHIEQKVRKQQYNIYSISVFNWILFSVFLEMNTSIAFLQLIQGKVNHNYSVQNCKHHIYDCPEKVYQAQGRYPLSKLTFKIALT